MSTEGPWALLLRSSIYRVNLDPNFEKYVAIIDQNPQASEKYENGLNLAKIKQ